MSSEEYKNSPNCDEDKNYYGKM